MFIMMKTFGAALLLCLIFTGSETRRSQRRRRCAKKYSSISPGHTMCLTRNPNAKKGKLSDTDKAHIVNMHNNIRAEVNPTASNMQKMKWDDDLAKVALRWAMQCPIGHDSNDNRKMPGLPGYVGQNYAAGQANFTEAVNAWYSEKSKWTYRNLTGINFETGHYEQQIWATVDRIGCGYAKCRNTNYTRYYICNYHTGPTLYQTPYETGQLCAKCPNHCDNNLCDCTRSGLCMNGGTRNLNTCKCDCTKRYSGDECNEKNCPKTDAQMCSYFNTTHCEMYWNIPQECPYMCGIC